MAIGMQKLAAGSGHEYLTQQVAALAATDRSRGTLVECYGAQGEWPGEWDGGGLDGVSLATNDPVTDEQVKQLFGAGLNPVTADARVSGTRSTPTSRPLSRPSIGF